MLNTILIKGKEQVVGGEGIWLWWGRNNAKIKLKYDIFLRESQGIFKSGEETRN